MGTDLSLDTGIAVKIELAVVVGRREFIAERTENQFVCRINDDKNDCSGIVNIREKRTTVNAGLVKIHRQWDYDGDKIDGIRLSSRFLTSFFFPEPDYYLYAGIDWNGNRFGIAENRIGEHKREERFCVPSCITMESGGKVLGVWTAPQQNLDDVISSGALKLDNDGRRHVIEIALPYRDEIPIRDMFVDQRMTLEDGMTVERDFYLFSAETPALAGEVDGRLNGYGLVLDAAWEVFSQESLTKPEMSLSDLQNIKINGLSRTPGTGLLRNFTYDGKDYTIHYIAKHVDEKNREMLHPYCGFSWSGAQALISYILIRESQIRGQERLKEIGESAIDFFLENGLSPCGLLYPVFFTGDSSFPWPQVEKPSWGSYINNVGHVDMYPLGEGLYWMLRAYRLDTERYKRWRESVTEICNRMMALWPDGDIPARVDGETAEAILPSAGRDGMTNASYLIWPFCELGAISNDSSYVAFAEKIAQHILAFSLRHEIYWKSEPDAHCIDKRAGFGAMRGYTRLYEATGKQMWLGAAIRASNWMKTWQWAYNMHFDPRQPLGHFDYRTVGGTSTRADHDTLQYGYAALAAGWCRLWEHTGDRQLLQRARALLHQGTQMVQTKERIKWLNENYFTKVKIDTESDFIGSHVENMVQVPITSIGRVASKKGSLQNQPNSPPFYAIFGLAMPLEWQEIDDCYGGLVWSVRWQNGGAVDTINLLRAEQDDRGVSLSIGNMLSKPTTYRIRILHAPSGPYRVDGRTLAIEKLEEGWTIDLEGNQEVSLRIEWG